MYRTAPYIAQLKAHLWILLTFPCESEWHAQGRALSLPLRLTSSFASSGPTGSITSHPANFQSGELQHWVPLLCGKCNSLYLPVILGARWCEEVPVKENLIRSPEKKKKNSPRLWAHRVISPQSEVYEAPCWILKTFGYWINPKRLLLLGRRPKKCPKGVLACFRYYINQDWNIQTIILLLLPLNSGLFAT